MIIVGCDPGLHATAAVAYDPVRDEVLGADSWSFVRKGMSRPERRAAYGMAFREFLEAWGSVDVAAFETQHASAICPTRAGEGTFGGRPLPPAIAAALKASETPARATRANRASERGGKNASMIECAKVAAVLEEQAEALGIRIVYVQPQEAKRALTGDARATKQQIAHWVRVRHPGLGGNEHTRDGLCIALAAAAKLRREEWRQ